MYNKKKEESRSSGLFLLILPGATAVEITFTRGVWWENLSVLLKGRNVKEDKAN